MKNLLCILFLLGISYIGFPQNKKQKALPSETEKIIPLVFHVIHGGGIENITDDQIIEAVKQINEDYNAQTPGIEDVIPEFKNIVANVGIKFALAKLDPDGNPTSGIVRYYDPALTTSLNDRDIFMKDKYRWQVGKYMNIYVVRSSNGESGSAYADGIYYEEGDDGIVNSYWALGRTRTAAPTHIKILTHEIGHWLGLGHTFSRNCEKDGDGITDTPPCDVGTGKELYDTVCGGLPNRQNFMDYSQGQVMFTNGQKEVMLNVLDTPRHGRNRIWKKENQLATGVTGIPLNTEFYSTQIMTVPGNAIKFVDITYSENSIKEWKWEFPGGTPETFTGKTPPPIIYNNTGTFDATLTVINEDGKKDTEVKKAYINVQNDIYMQTANFSVNKAKFYDPGYKTKYGCRTDLTLTLHPKTKGKIIQTIFNRFEMDPKGNDYLKIFDGSDTTNLIGTYYGYESPGIITSTHNSGALTFVFHSDKEYRYQGWVAEVKEINKTKVHLSKLTTQIQTKKILNIPYKQDFEGDFSPHDWQIKSDGPVIITEKVDYIGFQSESCLMLNNNINDSCNEVFVLPTFDLSKNKNIELSYNYAYTKFNEKSTCSIRILISTDKGNTWEKIIERDQDFLETAEINWIHSSGWLPKNDDEWRKDKIDLSKFAGNKFVLIKFESTTKFDTNIWIDNIAVKGE